MQFDVNEVYSDFYQEGSLCAQHCLNALLQGQYFSAVDLAEIANQLDEQERQQMAEGGTESHAYRQFMQQPSSNYDDSGFFSVQVIDNALRVWGLELLPYNSQNEISTRARDDPTQMSAYICNFGEHWFAIRQIGRQWFNLNSLLTGPELLSDTFLRLFLTQLQQDGYSIFIVTGNLMECEADQLLNLIPAVQPVRPQLIADAAGSRARASGEASKGSHGEDEQVKKALKESKDLNENDDKSLQRALQMSMEGYIEESLGRIEEATAGAAVSRQLNSNQGQGQTVNNNSQGEGHTLGGDNTETLQEPSVQPSAEEMRERRLAFFNKSQQDSVKTNSNEDSRDNVVNDSSVESSGCTEKQSHGELKFSSRNGKAPSDLTEEEMLEQALALSMQQGDT